MTVRLLAPFSGKAIGDFYSGPAEDGLISNGQAVNESGSAFWGSESTTHTLSSRDGSREFQFMSSTAVTVRVPKEIDQLPYGIIATYAQGGTGVVSIVGDTGVTVTATTGFARTGGQGAVIQVRKTGARTVSVIGALATA